MRFFKKQCHAILCGLTILSPLCIQATERIYKQFVYGSANKSDIIQFVDDWPVPTIVQGYCHKQAYHIPPLVVHKIIDYTAHKAVRYKYDIPFIASSWSCDGQWFSFCRRNGSSVYIQDTVTGQVHHKCKGHTAEVCSTCFTSDGKRVASAGRDHTLRIWDTDTAEQTEEIRTDTNYRIHWAPDNEHIAVIEEDVIVLINIYASLERRIEHENVACVRFSYDKGKMASGDRDGIIRIWYPDALEELQVLIGHIGGVYTLAWFKDGKRIFSAGRDQTLRVWDVETGQELRQCVGHAEMITAIALSPDEKYIASISQDKSIRVWEESTGKQVRQYISYQGVLTNVHWATDGLLYAATMNTLLIWNPKIRCKNQTTPPLPIYSLGKKIAQDLNLTKRNHYIEKPMITPQLPIPERPKTSMFPSVQTFLKKCKKKFKKKEAINYFLQPNSIYMIVENWYRRNKVQTSPCATSCPLDIGQLILQYTGACCPCCTYTSEWHLPTCLLCKRPFSPNNTIKKYEKIRHGSYLKLHTDVVSCLAPYGRKYVLSGSKDTTIRLWSLENSTCLHKFTGHEEPVTDMHYFGKHLLVSGSLDNTIKIWDIKKRECMRTFRAVRWGITRLGFLGEKTLIIGSRNGSIALWDIEKEEMCHKFQGQCDRINSFASIDPNTFASASNAYNVKIWDKRQCKPCIILSESVQYLAYLGGRLLVSGEKEKDEPSEIKITDLRKKAYPRYAKKRKGCITGLACLDLNRFATITDNNHSSTVEIWDKTLKRHHDFRWGEGTTTSFIALQEDMIAVGRTNGIDRWSDNTVQTFRLL